jgi:hypothetical protein
MTDIQPYLYNNNFRDMSTHLDHFESWHDYVNLTYFRDIRAPVFLCEKDESILFKTSIDIDFICQQFDLLTI